MQEGREGFGDVFNGVCSSWVISGVYDQIWFQVSEASDKVDFLAVACNQVHIADM